MKTKLKIKGMSCHHCEMKIARVLSEIEGIEVLKVSAKKGEAIIKTKSEVDDNLLEKFKKVIGEAGYEFIGA